MHSPSATPDAGLSGPRSLPSEEDLAGWTGSSEEERRGERGLVGSFQSDEELDKFVDTLRRAIPCKYANQL